MKRLSGEVEFWKSASTSSLCRGRPIVMLWISMIVMVVVTGKTPHTHMTGFGSRSGKSIFKEFPSTTKSTLFVKKHQDELWLKDCNSTLRISVTQLHDWQVTQLPNDSDEDDWIPIEGIFGMYKIPSGIVWVLITQSESVFEAPPISEKKDWWQIRRVNNVELVHLSSPSTLLLPSHLSEQTRQLNLLRRVLKQHDFYFCKGGSMTLNLQRSLDLPENQHWWDDGEQPLYDSRFFWNEHSVEPILERCRYQRQKEQELHQQALEEDASSIRQEGLEEVSSELVDESHKKNANITSTSWNVYDEILSHVIPVTSAFVGFQRNITVGTWSYDQVLISRRSKFRAGTRFTKRGADGTGAVANFAEAEQVLLVYSADKNLSHLLSHVQIRGSIPLRWSSPTDIKTYRPHVRIGIDPLAQARALRAHLVDLYNHYRGESDVIFLNLIDKKSDQGRLGRAFDAVLNAVVDVYKNAEESLSDNKFQLCGVNHIWFDFHAELKHGKWEKLAVLLNDLKPALVKQGYFAAQLAPENDSGWEVLKRQQAVVRTNCMDCLDRTNVVQSIVARYMLFRALSERHGSSKRVRSLPLEYSVAFQKNPLSLPWPGGETAHRLLWADNADAISRLYAGTPALKGDFTRTGKRTKRGALDDGMNSLQRYYLNNFLDSDRQEGMDLMVGFADFSNLDLSGITRTAEDTEVPNNLHGLTLTEAAREMLLGRMPRSEAEAEYIRIKQGKHTFKNRRSRIGLSGGTQDAVDFRWLPGDLQNHVRSHASQLNTKDPLSEYIADFSSVDALRQIDRRSASDLPWWVVHSDSEGEDTNAGSMVGVPTSTTNAAQVLGAILLGYQSPTVVAAAVVGLVGLATKRPPGGESF